MFATTLSTQSMHVGMMMAWHGHAMQQHARTTNTIPNAHLRCLAQPWRVGSWRRRRRRRLRRLQELEAKPVRLCLDLRISHPLPLGPCTCPTHVGIGVEAVLFVVLAIEDAVAALTPRPCASIDPLGGVTDPLLATERLPSGSHRDFISSRT